MQAQDIGEISICPYLALALCTLGYLALASAYDIMSDILRSCAGSQHCGDMLSAGSQSLALALEDVSQRCLLALARSSALSLSAGLSALGSLRWLSALWRYAQRWLSELGLGA